MPVHKISQRLASSLSENTEAQKRPAAAAQAAFTAPPAKKARRVDPDTGQRSTAPNAILYTTYYARQKVAPDTGQFSNAPNAITYGSYRKRQKVDPDTGQPSNAPNAITHTAYYGRQKVAPDTGQPSNAPNAITYTVYYGRQKVDPDTGQPKMKAKMTVVQTTQASAIQTPPNVTTTLNFSERSTLLTQEDVEKIIEETISPLDILNHARKTEAKAEARKKDSDAIAQPPMNQANQTEFSIQDAQFLADLFDE
jgi:hypothetical protein